VESIRSRLLNNTQLGEKVCNGGTNCVEGSKGPPSKEDLKKREWSQADVLKQRQKKTEKTPKYSGSRGVNPAIGVKKRSCWKASRTGRGKVVAAHPGVPPMVKFFHHEVYRRDQPNPIWGLRDLNVIGVLKRGYHTS